MNFEQLRSIVENGGKIEYVKCTDQFPMYYEENADPGMMFDIIGISYSSGEAYILELDFERYRKYNESIAQKNWFDANHIANLTWFESGNYPKNGIVTLYIDYWRKTEQENIDNANGVISECFDFSGIASALIIEYVLDKQNKSYVEWLETELLKERHK